MPDGGEAVRPLVDERREASGQGGRQGGRRRSRGRGGGRVGGCRRGGRAASAWEGWGGRGSMRLLLNREECPARVLARRTYLRQLPHQSPEMSQTSLMLLQDWFQGKKYLLYVSKAGRRKEGGC